MPARGAGFTQRSLTQASRPNTCVPLQNSVGPFEADPGGIRSTRGTKTFAACGGAWFLRFKWTPSV